METTQKMMIKFNFHVKNRTNKLQRLDDIDNRYDENIGKMIKHNEKSVNKTIYKVDKCKQDNRQSETSVNKTINKVRQV